MTPILAISSHLLFQGDGKSHPAEGIALLALFVLGIFCFDRFVIQREKHRRHWIAHKTFGEKAKFTVLQLIDFLVGLYFLRARVRDEPFRKATTGEKRAGACFMFCLPILFILLILFRQQLDAFVDSMTTGRHWIGWFYLCFMAFAGGGGAFGLVIAPKIPLIFSVPIAIISWLTLGWVIWTHHLI